MRKYIWEAFDALCRIIQETSRTINDLTLWGVTECGYCSTSKDGQLFFDDDNERKYSFYFVSVHPDSLLLKNSTISHGKFANSGVEGFSVPAIYYRKGNCTKSLLGLNLTYEISVVYKMLNPECGFHPLSILRDNIPEAMREVVLNNFKPLLTRKDELKPEDFNVMLDRSTIAFLKHWPEERFFRDDIRSVRALLESFILPLEKIQELWGVFSPFMLDLKKLD